MKIVYIILGVIVLGVISSFVISGSTKSSKSISNTTDGAATNEVTDQEINTSDVDEVVSEEDKARLADLKTKFDYNYDEFEEKGWYTPKTQIVENTFNKNLLRVHVNNSGYAYLSDQYYGDDWIFHTRIEVKIGDTIYKSSDIPSYDPSHRTDNYGGSVWETISYTGGRDNGIMKAIAESGSSTVKVRFTGGDGVHDFTLAKRDQQAIKDSYELSQLITKVGDNRQTQ